MSKAWILFITGVSPDVIENKDVISADTKNDKQCQDVEEADVSEVQDDAVDKVSTYKAGQNAENGKPSYP